MLIFQIILDSRIAFRILENNKFLNLTRAKSTRCSDRINNMALMETSVEIERHARVSALIPAPQHVVLRLPDSEHDGPEGPKARLPSPEKRESSPAVGAAAEKPPATGKRPLRAALIVGVSLISRRGDLFRLAVLDGRQIRGVDR
jgi:hypothetical protein